MAKFGRPVVGVLLGALSLVVAAFTVPEEPRVATTDSEEFETLRFNGLRRSTPRPLREWGFR
jgi:hypothetical protein